MWTGAVENRNKAPFTHSVAKLLCFQKGTVDAVKKGFRAKATVDSGAQKLSKVYLLSKNVYLRPQMCGTWCHFQSCKLLLSVDCGTHFTLYLTPAGMFAPHCSAGAASQQEWIHTYPSLCHYSSWWPALGGSCWCIPWSEHLPEDALCFGDMIQYKMQDLSELPLQLTEGQQLI